MLHELPAAELSRAMADGGENVPQNSGRSRRKQKSKDVRRAFEHAVKQEPAQTAILAENTFYFQQRRGRLDLRAIARIDIERVNIVINYDVRSPDAGPRADWCRV